MIRMQQNALVQHFKIEDPFFTAVPVQIVFLYAYFEREYIQKSVTLFTKTMVQFCIAVHALHKTTSSKFLVSTTNIPEFKRGGGGTFYEKNIPKICRKKREKIRKKISEYNKAFRRDDYILSVSIAMSKLPVCFDPQIHLHVNIYLGICLFDVRF